MTIWSYIVSIQQSNEAVLSGNENVDFNEIDYNVSFNFSITNSTNTTSEEFFLSAISSSDSTCSDIPDDGGLILNFLADIVVAGFILICAVLAWVCWLNKEEQKALSSNPDLQQNTGSEVEYENEPGMLHETKIVWYKAICQIWATSDTTVELRQGIDGVRYIHLSEYLHILMIIITVLCVCIILPINMTGDQETRSFAKLCITNLSTDSSLLWAHFILAPLFLLITLIIVWIYTGELGTVKLEDADRVAIVKGVDINWREEEYWNYFGAQQMKEAVVDIQLGYDVSDLYEIAKQREDMVKLQTRYKDLRIEEPDGDMTYNTGACGCCGEEVDGFDHFTKHLAQCNDALREERTAVKTKRCNFVFVVWSTPGHCKMFVNTHKLANICGVMQDQKEYGTSAWQVRLAPIHHDVNWENMSIPKWLWWTRVAIINFILLLFVVFFTTPIMVVVALTAALDIQFYISSFYYIYFTILLLIILTNILPEIVNWTCKLEKHRTKSGYYHWVLKKAFIYLMVSVELLPLAGEKSIAMFLSEFFSDVEILSTFSCIFSAYNSAFFCNLMIAAALVGRSIELLQIKGIYTYIWERSRTRTKRELLHIFKNIKRSFNIGYNYAKLQCYLCIVISFSLICPLITVFGMFFVLLKYTVDKYLMVHCTKPCGSYNPATHYTSAYFTVFSAVLLQIFMFLYAVLYIGVSDSKTILSGIVLLLIIVFIATKLGEMCYTALFPRPPDERDFIAGPGSEQLKDAYIPPVMSEDRKKMRTKRAYHQHHKTYSLSSISALIDSGIVLPNYKTITSKVGSISGRSIRSYLDGNLSDSLAGPSSVSDVEHDHVIIDNVSDHDDVTLTSDRRDSVLIHQERMRQASNRDSVVVVEEAGSSREGEDAQEGPAREGEEAQEGPADGVERL